MKKQLLVLIICFWCLQGLKANDTLTRAQVYNFNVGDTFDYQISNVSTIYYWEADNYGFVRNVIEDTHLSPTSDTLFITARVINPYSTFNVVTTMTDLGSDVVPDSVPYCSGQLFIDTNSVYNGRTVNHWYLYGLGCGGDSTFGLGIGLTSSNNGYGDGMGAYQNTNTNLIYYSKGTERYGSPYYNFTGEQLLDYKPIPEECAKWVSEIRKIYPYPSPTAVMLLVVQEEIKTGNKMTLNGHTYVELIYTGYNYSNQDNHIDSLVGYFRNDTLNKSVLFRDLFGNETLLYDFRLVNGTAYNKNHITLDTMIIDADTITLWTSPSGTYAEGIGGLWGFLKAKSVQEYASGGYTYTKYGTLTCFSVCGQTIYPSAASVCPLVNAVDEIVGNSPHFSLSPNPASHQVNIQVDESMATSFVSVTDVIGQTVMQFQVSATQTTLSTQNLPDGIYLVTLQHRGQRSTQKLVVGH